MITGFVLAGGQSSRMGREKAWLPIGSRPLIEVILGRIRHCVDRTVIIANLHNRSEFEHLAVEAVLTDIVPGCGPLMGVYTGLMHTETELNVFVSCDMPWIAGEWLEELMAACSLPALAVASQQPGCRIQPLPLVCRAKVIREVGALLNLRERSLQALFKRPRTRLITVEAPRLWPAFANINTPEDYARLCGHPVMPMRKPRESSR